MDPPPLFAHPHSGFVLVENWGVYHRRSEDGFHLDERLVTGFDRQR
jgi:hypothetical protein